MNKTVSTEIEILLMLSSRKRTLRNISMELELAPEAVSKHIHRLKSIGAVAEVKDYYEIVPSFDFGYINAKYRFARIRA